MCHVLRKCLRNNLRHIILYVDTHRQLKNLRNGPTLHHHVNVHTIDGTMICKHHNISMLHRLYTSVHTHHIVHCPDPLLKSVLFYFLLLSYTLMILCTAFCEVKFLFSFFHVGVLHCTFIQLCLGFIRASRYRWMVCTCVSGSLETPCIHYLFPDLIATQLSSIIGSGSFWLTKISFLKVGSEGDLLSITADSVKVGS